MTTTHDTFAVGSKLFQSEPLDPQPVHKESVTFKDVHVEVVDYEHVGSELHDSHTVGSVRIHSQPASPEQVHSELPSTSPNNMRQTSGEFVNPNATEPSEAANAEVVYSQVESDPRETYVVYSEYGQQVDIELVHSEDMDLSDSQTIDAEIRNMDAMLSEHADSEAASHGESTEPMFTGTMSLEPDHSHPIGAEVVYSQHCGSEVFRCQSLSSEIVYSQPLSSEIVHTHVVGSELAHLQPGSSGLFPSHSLKYEPMNVHPSGVELLNSQIVSSEIASPDAITPGTQPNKRRKKASIVWEHFTIEPVGEGCRRAFCKVCRQSFAYSTGSKVAGTSHLKRHIAKGTCAVTLQQHEKNQLLPYMPKNGDTATGPHTQSRKRRGRVSSSPYLIFDQEKCRSEIARMIIMHEYPLNIVEHPGFVAFVQNLQPRFHMANLDTVRGDCVAMYTREKQNLQKLVEGLPGRICLMLDMWSSSQSTSYIFLTGQFIDDDWKVHRRLLNVVMEPFPDSEGALSRAVATCLSHWGLKNKLLTITVDQPLSDTRRENLVALLSTKTPRTLNGQLLVAKCLAHTLSCMAVDVLAASQHVVRKVRESVKHVKASDSHEEKFLELKQQLQVPSEKTLDLDNLTYWDTTYHMLLAASELKEVFSCLDTSDPEYKDAPTLEEWKQVESLCAELQLLYETASLLTGNTIPSPNMFFHEVRKILVELARTASSDDPFASYLARQLQEKFNKYCEDTFVVLATAVTMDPRFKMKYVTFSFTQMFGDKAPRYITAVEEGLHEMFHEYKALALPLTSAGVEDSEGKHVVMEKHEKGDFLTSNGLSDFETYIMETSSQQSKSELDQYLEESLLPRVQAVDVLAWWKLHRIKYPTLSKMARDILTISLSTVGPDSVFDTVGKEMDLYRCSLRPEILEALICAKDWLQHETFPEVLGGGAGKMEV